MADRVESFANAVRLGSKLVLIDRSWLATGHPLVKVTLTVRVLDVANNHLILVLIEAHTSTHI